MSSRPSLAAKAPFFIIGAQRSGTTYLYDLLAEHPQVAMAVPKKPEPKWFLNAAKAASGPKAWEETLFPGVTDRVRGEKGTSYIEHPEAARAILSTFPEARFIAILREPVARAVSNYRFSLDNQVETLPIEEALTPEAEKRSYDRSRMSTSPFYYLKRGHYVDYLEGWTALAAKDRLHVVLFEELTAGEGTFRGLCSFLGLETFLPKGLGKVVNAATEPMPEITSELRSRLKAHFEGPNARLEKFLGRPLGPWKT